MPLGSGGISPFPGGGAQGEIIQWPGVYYGAVSNNADPKKQNRCLLRIPQILGSAVTTWAISLTPQQNPPKVGTLIAAMFVGGDLDYPCYLVVNPKITVESTDGNIQPIGTASHAGTSKSLAAADHIHAGIDASVASIQPVGAAASAGVNPLAPRSDHVHAGLAAGSGGFLEITSSTQSGSDSPAVIDMYSQFTVGQTEIDLTATNVNASDNFSCANIVINNAPSNTTSSIAGGNTVPGSGPASYSSTWASEVGATIALMFGAINQLNTTIDNIYNNLYS